MKDVPPPGNVEALTLERWWMAPHVKAERTDQPEESDHARKAEAGMGKVRRQWFLNRGRRLRAKVIPGIVPPAKSGHLPAAWSVNAGMDLDKRRPQAPGLEAGITGTGTGRGH